jgi:hypothetical protein
MIGSLVAVSGEGIAAFRALWDSLANKSHLTQKRELSIGAQALLGLAAPAFPDDP